MNTVSFIPTNAKRIIDHRRQQFTESTFAKHDYKHRLNSYKLPPTADITLEQFEQWAIDRLRILAELEACAFRNRSSAETAEHMKPLLKKYMLLDSNSSASGPERLYNQRQKDHYSHFILRLAFCTTEDLRRRFVRVETMLFRLRIGDEAPEERRDFINSLNLGWKEVPEEERMQLLNELTAVSGIRKGEPEETSWKKVDWEKVPDLVEQRKVFLMQGMAYIPSKEQASMVVTDFETNLKKNLEACKPLGKVRGFGGVWGGRGNKTSRY